MKYVMLKRDHCGMEQHVPIIFPTMLSHSDVADAMKNVPELKDAQVHSAGEISPMDMVATGKSITLQVEADEDDTQRIMMIDYYHGLR